MDHLPWYFNPQSACWKCQSNYGRQRMLENHIKTDHKSDNIDVRFSIDRYGQQWIQYMNEFLHKYESEQVFEFVNTHSDFMSCKTSVWRDNEKETTQFFANAMNKNLSLFDKPYPVYNFLSLFHWRVATILITHQDQLPLRNVTESVHDRNKLVVIVGSSIVYWAHERVKVLNKVQLDLSCTTVV